MKTLRKRRQIREENGGLNPNALRSEKGGRGAIDGAEKYLTAVLSRNPREETVSMGARRQWSTPQNMLIN